MTTLQRTIELLLDLGYEELVLKLEAMRDQQPVTRQFKCTDGTWSHFMNDRHYQETVKDGSWPIRSLYAHQLTPCDLMALAEEVSRSTCAWTAGLIQEPNLAAIVAKYTGAK